MEELRFDRSLSGHERALASVARTALQALLGSLQHDDPSPQSLVSALLCGRRGPMTDFVEWLRTYGLALTTPTAPWVVICGSADRPDRIAAAVAAELAAGRLVIAWPVEDAFGSETERAAAWRRYIQRCDDVVIVVDRGEPPNPSIAADHAYATEVGRTIRLWPAGPGSPPRVGSAARTPAFPSGMPGSGEMAAARRGRPAGAPRRP